MTKVTILGQAEAAEPKKKKIEFVKCIDSHGEKSEAMAEPYTWGNIVLLAANWQSSNMDLMFAYDDTESALCCLYLGHFNDGVV